MTHGKSQIARTSAKPIALFGCLLLAGCQQQMAHQPSYHPLEANSFFANGQSSRQLVAGTVARGHLEIDRHLYTGRMAPTGAQLAEAKAARTERGQTKDARARAEEIARGNFVETFPFPVSLDVLEQGYHRYMIYCVVCHDPLGTGHGKIVERGYTAPPSYHIPRLRSVPVGHIFAVISDGYGSMPSYGAQIPLRDRWAIVAYVRALQQSQHFPVDQLTPEMRKGLADAEHAKEAP
jgi:mono/diheme cytochrome c family protein